MHFLAQDEANFLETKLRRQMVSQPTPKLVLYYESGERDYSDAANAITASIGDFTEANLHFAFCVSGDGWNEGTATNELGWDALVAAEPGRQLLLLSHDDRIEIYRGFEWPSLAEKLIRLGYWRRQ